LVVKDFFLISFLRARGRFSMIDERNGRPLIMRIHNEQLVTTIRMTAFLDYLLI